MKQTPTMRKRPKSQPKQPRRKETSGTRPHPNYITYEDALKLRKKEVTDEVAAFLFIFAIVCIGLALLYAFSWCVIHFKYGWW